MAAIAFDLGQVVTGRVAAVVTAISVITLRSTFTHFMSAFSLIRHFVSSLRIELTTSIVSERRSLHRSSSYRRP